MADEEEPSFSLLGRAVLSGLPDLKFRLSFDGTILEYVPGSDDLLLMPPESFLGHCFSDILPGPAADRISPRLAELRRTGKLQTFDYQLELPQGLRDFEARLFRISDEQAVIFVRDVSAQREAGRELTRFRTILDATPDFVGSATPAGRVTYVNATGRRMVGFSSEEDLSQRGIDEFHPPSTNEFMRREIIPTAIATGSWTGEAEFLHRDGTCIPVWMVLLAHRGPTGEIDFLSTISRDLREKKRAEEREREIIAAQALAEAERGKSAQLERALSDLKHAHEELKSAQDQLRQSSTLAAVGQLAGGVAHDFNNLLSVISGFITLAIDGLPDEHAARDDLEEARLAAGRAAKLTQQLLAFSRKKPVRPEVMQLSEIVNEMSHLLGRSLGEDIQLETSSESALMNVRIDRSQIEQVLLNLAVNARDAMPKGGQLRIELRNVDLSTPVPAHGLRAGRHVQLIVSDTGTGMSPEVAERAFEPFFTTKEVGKGTGMGLAMVFGVIKQAGGEVFIDTAPGRGTSVRIYLPEAVGARDEADANPPPSTTRGPARVRILLVEDDPSVREVTRRILVKSGYEVVAAGGGREALALLALTIDVQLLLTDVVMPGMSGVELAERVQIIAPGVRVVYMSGYPERGTEHHLLLQRDVHYIAKPFSEAELLAALSLASSSVPSPAD